MGDESEITETDLPGIDLRSQILRPRNRIVDFGPGSGAGLDYPRRNSTGSDFIAIGSGLQGLPNHSVDLLLAFDVIDQCSNPGALSQEIRRVLIPGGRLILSTSEARAINWPRSSAANFYWRISRRGADH